MSLTKLLIIILLIVGNVAAIHAIWKHWTTKFENLTFEVFLCYLAIITEIILLIGYLLYLGTTIILW